MSEKMGEKSKPSALVIPAIVLLSVFSILLLANLSCLLRRRATMYNALRHDFNGGNNSTSIQSLQFDFKTLETATSNFSDSKKLGQGEFGKVYKGMLLNGQEIAVKRLSKTSRQGAEEFKNEVLLMAELQHRNLVKLMGFCLEGDEKILVYEYVPNTSLDHFLFDPKTQDQLNWSTRCQIIEGNARGIFYLHEDYRLRIIHRDLKASNILLDFNLNAKISNFGTTRLFGVEQTQENTQKKTCGYMASEYVVRGQYSIKYDVFSFGVLLLEILSGRRNSGFDLKDSAPSLIAHAWHLWNQEKGLELMDPIMRETCPISDEFMRYLNIGLLCVQDHPKKRPNMSSVILMLQSEALSLFKPGRPAFSVEGFTDQHEMSIQEFSYNSVSVSDFGAR